MSSRVAIGSIPDKICYVYSNEEEVIIGSHWDVDWGDKSKNSTTKVLPTYPIEEGDEKAKARAITWAESSYYKEPKGTAKFKVVDNKPITDIKVISLEERGQGGRAYKVLVGKHYVDLREDVLVDTMLQSGIQKGGILLGKYVWAKLQGQIRLVRVGSELHKLIIEFESKKDTKPVGKGDLEVGGVYQTRKKEKAVFIGYVNTTVFRQPVKDWNKRADTKASFDYEQVVIKKAMLFYDFFKVDSNQKNVAEMMSTDYSFKIKKTHSFIEKVDQVEIPDNVVEILRTRAQKKIKELILEYTGHKEPKKNFYKIDEHTLEDRIARESDHLNLYVYNDAPTSVFDVKKYLLFS